MGYSDRSRFARARLAVELLEDRTTPTKLGDPATLALPDFISTGDVVGDRVNVVMSAPMNNATDAAALAATPFAQSVNALGFGIYSVTLRNEVDLATAVQFYRSFNGVVSAAPDEIIRLQATPNDTSYSSLYGLTKIGAPTAWDTTTGSSSFIVAVIDSGVDYNHPDLAANMWVNPNETAGNGIDDDGNGIIDDIYGADFANNDGNPMDDNNHGTHVAGTIGAVGNNNRGVVGVNWNVKIMALKFLGANGSGAISGAISSLNYAVNKGVLVSNNSWGGGGYSTTMAAAIGRAQDIGHIFVAAAGNSGQNIDTTASYPASYIQSYDNVVTVAATNSTDTLASFSNFGANSVTLAAPGVSILSTTPNNTYSTFSGTSMAAPHVAGAIALYWSANPDLTYSEVIAKLTESVDTVSGLSGKVSTGGRLNVANMFENTSPPTVAPGPKVTAATYSGTTNTQFDKVRITFDKAINASSFTSADIVSFTGPNGAITTSYTVTPVSGSTTQFDVSFAAQTAAGTYSMVIGPDIRDTSGNQMNQNGNGTAGETADSFTATGNLVLTVNRTYSASGLPLAIRDNATTTSTITITDKVKISDLNVRVSLTHTYTSDLVITLTSPTVNGVAGKTITLFNRRGGSGDNLTGTTFDDEATTLIANGRAPFSGSFRPDGALNGFDGLSTAGVWTLQVSDRATRDIGNLTAWSMSVTGTIGDAAGSSSAKTLGFLDEPMFATDDFTEMEFDLAPLAVSVSAPVQETAPAFDVSYRSSERSMSWFSPDAERREYAPPQDADSDSDTDESDDTRPTTSEDFSENDDPAVAMLYFPPATTEAVSVGLDDAE